MRRLLVAAMAALAVVALLDQPATASAGSSPGSGGTYVALPAARIVDSRHGLGAVTPSGRATVAMPVLGHGGVPTTGVSAVVATLTVAAPKAGGYLTAFRTGTSRPAVSALNFATGQTVANSIVVPVGPDGTISVYNGSAAPAPLILDVSGFYRSGSATTPGAFTPAAPVRVLDTRHGLGGHRPGANGTVRLALGHPSTPVLLNVTATGATRAGHLAVLPGHGGSGSVTTSLSFPAGASVANLVLVTTDADGQVGLANASSGSTDLLADVVGTFGPGAASAPGALVAPATPTRVFDSRTAHDPVAGTPRRVTVGGFGDLPASGIAAVVVQVTITGATGDGYFRATNGGSSAEPTGTSITNFTRGRTVTTLVELPLGGSSDLDVANVMARGLTADVILDVVGFTRDGAGASLASLTGVTRSEEKVVPGVTVLVFAGDTVVARGRSDATGKFRVDGVPASDPTDEVCFDASTATTTVRYASECYEHLEWDAGGPPTGEQVPVVAGTLGGEAEALFLTPLS